MEVKTPDERLKVLENLLDEYHKTVGTNTFTRSTEVDEILELSPNDIRSMTEEECGESAYVLQRYAGYIQKESNRNESRIKWCNRCIDIEIAERMMDYGDKYTKFDERKFRAINDKTNAYMKRLQELLMHADIRKTEIQFLSSKVSSMANTLLEQRQIKRKTKWES